MTYINLHDKFRTEEYQNSWRCITCNTFENMELYYRRFFSIKEVLNYFETVFDLHIEVLFDSSIEDFDEDKLLLIYLLTKYSKEDFQVIANKFNISLDTVKLIDGNDIFKIVFQDNIQLFFKQFESDYLADKKQSLQWKEFLEVPLSRQSNVKEDII